MRCQVIAAAVDSVADLEEDSAVAPRVEAVHPEVGNTLVYILISYINNSLKRTKIL